MEIYTSHSPQILAAYATQKQKKKNSSWQPNQQAEFQLKTELPVS
jgi:hypothetical protein